MFIQIKAESAVSPNGEAIYVNLDQVGVLYIDQERAELTFSSEIVVTKDPPSLIAIRQALNESVESDPKALTKSLNAIGSLMALNAQDAALAAKR